ncbi:restriction endonuclease subunit S [Lachnospiraceae bacterium 62-35]
MSWEKVKLGDVSESCLGKMLDQRKNKGTYKPYLANVNVRWGSFDLDNLQEMKFEDDEDERYGIKYGDLIICEGGEPGRCAIWKEELPNMKIQKALHRVRVNEEMDYRYVYYWFLLAGKQGALKQYYTGATIMHMPGQKLKEVVIDKPPLDVQRRIGYYLESFDNLIDNNQKQIKLIEEAAQRLYKEWFVDLRFPGYEDVKIVDGVPEGWNCQFLTEVVGYEIGGGWGEDSVTEKCDKPAYVIRGTDLHGITNGNISGIPYRYHANKNLEARALEDGDIIFEVSGGSKAEGVARTVLIRDTVLEFLRAPVMCASFCKLVRVNEKQYSQLLFDTFQYMRYSGKTGEYDKKSASSIVNYRWKDFLVQETILIPTNELLLKYNSLSANLYHMILTKSVEIEKAKEARDRLLPKLMSGEIEV